MHCSVPLQRMENSRQISKWDESAVHLAGPRCNIFDPTEANIKDPGGGFALMPAWAALKTMSTNLQPKVQLNMRGGFFFFTVAEITTIVQSL